MANRSATLVNTGSPEVNPFIFYKSGCPPEIKIKEFKSNNWEWAEFIMKNRDKSSSFDHGYDIVIGPVADSRVDPIIEDYKKEFENSYYTHDNLKILADRLKYPGPQYIQYCFCTEKALKLLIRD